MAEERQVAAPKPTKQTAAKPATVGTVTQLRTDLAAARRDLALEKLSSPTQIRQLRKNLARALTAERAKAIPAKVTAAAKESA